MRFAGLRADARRRGSTLLCAVAVACGGSEKPSATPRQGAESTRSTDPSQPPQGAEGAGGSGVDAEAQALVDAALNRISELRRLAPKGPVEARHLSAAELVGEVEGSLDRHVPPRAVAGTAEMLFGLGTVPPEFDYRASLLSLMGTDLAGLYDPERKTMFLRADMDDDALEATLLHELVHALQDQHYGLARILEWRDDATDELSALSALAEGDATSAMLDALLAETGQVAHQLPTELMEAQMRLSTGSSHDSSAVPGILKRSLISPYVDGLRFVNEVRRQRGWAGVDAVWERPPVTTEQLLHLDKYTSAEPAEPVAVPPGPTVGPAGTPWEVLLHDVWGEQSLRLLFEEWMPARSAAASATGWAGDRIVLFGAEDRRGLVWRVIADDEASAERMHVAFLRGVFGRGWSADPRPAADVSEQTARAKAAAGELCQERTQAGPFLAERRGRGLVVVAGLYERLGAGQPPRALATCEQARRWAKAIFEN